jgi:hypothetical protein
LGISQENIACRIIEKKKIVRMSSRIDNADRANNSTRPGLLMQFIPNKISEEIYSIINASIMDAIASL